MSGCRSEVDLAKYQGLWYEIQSANVFPTKGCECSHYNWTLTSATTFSDACAAQAAAIGPRSNTLGE